LNSSKGLIFPVLWHEPFGLAITESLFYGCPIFATPYGSLPELVNPEIGFLSNNSADLAEAILQSDQYNSLTCHAIARDLFDSKTMAKKYLSMYEKVLNGEQLNQENPQILEQNTPKFLPWS
jgi:glycosyltransferase involved in cell wall biosynthesis